MSSDGSIVGGTNAVVEHVSGLGYYGNATLTPHITGLTFLGSSGGQAVNVFPPGNVYLTDCKFLSKDTTIAYSVITRQTATIHVGGCTFGPYCRIQIGSSTGNVKFSGSNTFKSMVINYGGTVTVSAGTILDFTGNTNFNVIPSSGGSVTFLPGGATVYPSAGQASAYTLDNVTVPQLRNDNVIDLGGTQVIPPNNATVSISGCTFTNGSGNRGGAFYQYNGNTTLILKNVQLSGNKSTVGAALAPWTPTAKLIVSSCIISGNTGTYGDVYIAGGTMTIFDSDINVITTQSTPSTVSITFTGVNNRLNTLAVRNTTSSGTVIISSGASITLSSYIAGAISVVGGSCVINGTSIESGTYTKITSVGGSASATI